jgi:hypothetical protein
VLLPAQHFDLLIEQIRHNAFPRLLVVSPSAGTAESDENPLIRPLAQEP